MALRRFKRPTKQERTAEKAMENERRERAGQLAAGFRPAPADERARGRFITSADPPEYQPDEDDGQMHD
jgi:hypothetical protein